MTDAPARSIFRSATPSITGKFPAAARLESDSTKAFFAGVWRIAGLLAALCAPAHATVAILSMSPSLSAPQAIGTPIVWIVAATDSNPGPLTFQFNVAAPGGSFTLAKDFNVGTLTAGVWTSLPFAWTPTQIEGHYQIQVVVKDFTSGQTASSTSLFQVTPLASGSTPVVVPTANPLVALFGAPACAAGSSMRVFFQEQSESVPAAATNAVSCHPPATMNFEIAGMYPNTAYKMFAQTITAGVAANGPKLIFTTGALAANVPFPSFKTIVQTGQIDSADSILLLSPNQLGSGKTNLPALATDLSGSVIWYYYPSTADHFQLLTRPLPGGTFLTIQDDTAWNPASAQEQVLREVDLAGNIVRETNTGAIQQQLLALGATDAAACNSIASPAPVGAACLGGFHHDAIRTLPNGQTAVLTDIEKIFPAGTQGDTSGLPVDIVGDMIVVLNSNWQVAWFFDSFQHAGGGTQLNLDRPAVLGETCVNTQAGCPPIFLLGPGIAPLAKDWLHANSLYYQPQDGSIVWSSRSQDWIMKVDYDNGIGKAHIYWRMGLDGDFTFINTYNDPWPWFSHQHEAGMENGGLGPMTIMDNGNTRVSPPPLGLGSGDSRGMALTVNAPALPAPCTSITCTVMPVLSADLGVYSEAMGSAQLMSSGNYFFLAAIVSVSPGYLGYSIGILPASGTDAGTLIYKLLGPESYRAWLVPNLYQPPTT
jgi:arylsulfate sulfotransferase